MIQQQRLHLVSLPHTETTLAYSSCAYTEKVRKFCDMMTARGHQVFLYAGPRNEAECYEHIVCASQEMLEAAQSEASHYTRCSFDDSRPHWQAFNQRCIDEIRARAKPDDIVCYVGGWPQRHIAEALPQIQLHCEFGIGYSGTFANYRVFESYAWMHSVYAAQNATNVMSYKPKWFDAVIPGFYDPALFPQFVQRNKRENYALFLGRVTELKGYRVAIEACERADIPLVLAGPLDPDQSVPVNDRLHYVGEVKPAERAKLLSRARCLLAPSLYAEPFGNVVIEAFACGTPAITSDWGAFSETVLPFLGRRCRMLRDFVAGIHETKNGYNNVLIREHARNVFSMDAVAPLYESYFDRLQTLNDAEANGWYAP